jgi:hypothetical protein
VTDKLDEKVNIAIETAIQKHGTEGLVVLLPKSLTLLEFAKLLKCLGRMTNWNLRAERIVWNGVEYAIVGVDVYSGIDQDTPVFSELVAFGPYDHLPTTRLTRSPVLTLRTKPTNSLEPLAGRNVRRGNLAAIPIDVPSHTFDVMWKKSQDLRRELDGPTNPLVRARVTLPFPFAVWQSA